MNTIRYFFFHSMKPLLKTFFFIRYGFRTINNPLKGVNGPYLVIGHHVMSEDPLFVLCGSRQLIHFLAADANMDTPWKRILFNAMGMIPFKKRKSDIKAIRHLSRLIKENQAIGLFPEGGRTWDGATETPIPSTAKLIKMLGVDVYITFYRGGYLTSPRWADHNRKGRIHFDGYQLFSHEDLKEKSTSDIFNVLSEALCHNDYEWQHKHMIPFKGTNKASGIARILYKCPACNKDQHFVTSGDDFTCSSCNETYTINTYGFIEGNTPYENTVDWVKWQRSHLPKLIDSLQQIELNDIIYETRHSKTKERKIYPHCNVNITNDGLLITAASYRKHLSIKDTFGFSFTLKDLFEFYTNDYKHRLIINPTKHPSNLLIIDICEQLKENSLNE